MTFGNVVRRRVLVPSGGATLWARRYIADVDSATAFRKQLAEEGPPALVFYTARWCSPCRDVAPHIEALGARLEGPHLRIFRVDVDDHERFAADQGVKAVPFFTVHRDGHVVERLAGCGPDAVAEAAQRHAEIYAERL
eukprot:CAMPEP_0172749252 /NCGR_PEP_ID=MMETSP1074-20121228/146926_1 /TAXON_ID=2916 /ORGANISM="Ceratium fusus, Strain PA161109" /LENGTH=137 /DNA_ID=CAMNT_0013581165 /DNA_START=14 /DNA_END=423 /DNA_ORIENTATION=+